MKANRSITCQKQSYSRFRVFSPDCTLHSAITHVISVLEWRRLMHDYAIGIHMRLHRSNTFITWVIAVCNVHLGLKTLKWLYTLQKMHMHAWDHIEVVEAHTTPKNLSESYLKQNITHNVSWVRHFYWGCQGMLHVIVIVGQRHLLLPAWGEGGGASAPDQTTPQRKLCGPWSPLTLQLHNNTYLVVIHWSLQSWYAQSRGKLENGRT